MWRLSHYCSTYSMGPEEYGSLTRSTYWAYTSSTSSWCWLPSTSPKIDLSKICVSSCRLNGVYANSPVRLTVCSYVDDLDGPNKNDPDEGGIEFEGVHIDDDPTASMVVMRRFLFYTEDSPQIKQPVFKIEKLVNGDSVSSNGLSNMNNTLTTATNKSSRRVTLFEGRFRLAIHT